MAYLGLSEVVKHVIKVSSSLYKLEPRTKMELAWRILDPFHDYIARPLRSDLAGLHIKNISKSEATQKLQLILPFISKNQTLFEKFINRLKHKVNIDERFK